MSAEGDASVVRQRFRGGWRSVAHRVRWIALLLGLGVTASCVQMDDSVTDERQVVMRVERDGTAVDRDSELNGLLAGDIVLEERTAQAAYCVNGWYWANDVTLDLTVLVATSPRLVRAAEVVEAGDFDVVMASAVEQSLLDSDVDAENVTVSDLDAQVRDRWDVADLEAYLQATSLPASEAASQRFVVYAVSRTTSLQRVYFIDLGQADRAAILRFAQRPNLENDIFVAGSGIELTMASRDCDDLDFP